MPKISKVVDLTNVNKRHKEIVFKTSRCDALRLKIDTGITAEPDATVELYIKKPNGKIVSQACTMNGTVATIDVLNGATDIAGLAEGIVKITDSEGEYCTPTFHFTILDSFAHEDSIINSVGVKVFEDLLNRLNAIENSGIPEQVAQIKTNKTDIADLKESVGDYSSGLVRAVINNASKLNTIVVEGATKKEVTNVQQQINNLVLGAVGDGNNAEVIQARGKFTTLNDRFEYNSIDNLLDISKNVLNPNECIENASVGWKDGGYKLNVVSNESNYCLSPIINVTAGQKFIFNYKGYQTNIYLSDDTFSINANNMLTIEANTPFTIPENVTKMRYRFTINGSDLNNGQWKNKVMLCKGETIPTEFSSYNSKIMKSNIEIPLYTKKTDSILYTKIEKRTERLLGDKAIVIPSFDGMNINTFDTVIPYMKEKGLPFTIFSNGDISNDLIKRFQTVYDNGGEIQFYDGQPASTYEGTDNYIEQYNQFKNNYETFLQLGVGKPKFVAYSGGRHTEITERIAKQFGIKWARTTESDFSAAKSWNDELFNTPAFFMNNSNFTTMINISDWDIQNKMIRPFLNHNILSDTVTDANFNIEWNNLKQVLDKLYELKQNGSIYVMNYSQLFDFLRFPKDVEVGHHVLVYEADNKQHEYVKTGKGWIELTNN